MKYLPRTKVQCGLVMVSMVASFAAADAFAFKVHSFDTDGTPVLIEAERASMKLSRRVVSQLVARECELQKVNCDLVVSVVEQESQFNPHAVSQRGALGLMQLMPATAKRFGVNDPFNPAESIRGGVAYLKFLLGIFHNDVVLALLAYHGGHNRLLGNAVRNIPASSRKYVTQVLTRAGIPQTRIGWAIKEKKFMHLTL